MLPRRLIPMVLMGGVLAACGTPPATTPPATSAPTQAGPTGGQSPRASVEPDPLMTPGGSLGRPPISDEPPALGLEAVASGLSEPTNITATPDGWLLVNERAGRVMAVDPETGSTTVALDITDRVLGEGERGLLGLALHPDWPEAGRAFVHYTDRNGNTVLSEFAADGDDPQAPPALDPASEAVLLRHVQPYANHNGGQLAFGPDGHLHLGLGDGGSGGDPHGNGQDPDTLLGTILRLDVSQRGAVRAADGNPFADGSAGRPEVFVYGLRNPWRFSFDRATGDLWIADVGQNAFEEVNRLDPAAQAGANLGWAVMEASHCFASPDCSTDGLVLPVTEYGRDGGCSVIGGHVYRGRAIEGLAGWYVFGDHCSGLVFGVRSDAEALTAPRVLFDTDARISSFGEGPDGALYLADLDSGTIYRILPD